VPQAQTLVQFLNELRDAASTGRWLDGDDPGGRRHLDAEVVNAALLGSDGIRALRLRNFIVDGSLSLCGLSLAGEFALEHCELTGDLELVGGEVGALRVVDSTVDGSLQAGELAASNSLILDRSIARKGVFAPNSKVDGRVSCDGLAIPEGTVNDDHVAAVSFEGATVGGRLSARLLDAVGEVTFNGSRVDGEFDLTDAKLHGDPVSLRLENVHITDTAFIKGSRAYGDFEAAGQILLAGSEFAGGLNCTGVTVGKLDTGGRAVGVIVDGRNIRVGGELFLNHGMIAGGVVMTAAEVRGQINLSGLKLLGAPPAAIDARGMRIGTDAWLDDCFESSAAVILDRSTIGGSLNAVAGRFTADQREGARYRGLALSLASANLGGSLVLADEEWTSERDGPSELSGFRAVGTVVLTDTHVGRRLEASGGIFDGCGGDALRADGIHVDGDARLRGGVGPDGESRFQAFGPVRLTRATVEGSLDLTSASARLGPRVTALSTDADEARADGGYALDASLMRVRDRLVLRQLDLDGPLSLSGAQVGTLSDDHSYWRPNGSVLELDEFTYSFLDRESLGWRAGRDWLARLGRYRAQPYLQLARVERDMGRPRDARRLNMERHYARLSRRPPPSTSNPVVWLVTRMARAADRMVGFLVGWGYAPWRLAPVWGVMLALAFVVFHWAGEHNKLLPSQPQTVANGPTPESSRCASDYPCFESFTYSIDAVLPIVDLKQRERWYVDTRSTGGEDVAIASLVFTLVGWAFATLLAASFTNVLRRE
jgi:hypothetical protein